MFVTRKALESYLFFVLMLARQLQNLVSWHKIHPIRLAFVSFCFVLFKLEFILIFLLF